MRQIILAMRSLLKNIILMLKKRIVGEDSYERAMQQALARKPFLKTDWPFLSREEAHFRSGAQ